MKVLRPMTVQEVAEESGVSDSAVYRWIASGRLAHYRLPGSGKKRPDMLRVTRKDFDEFWKSFREGGV